MERLRADLEQFTSEGDEEYYLYGAGLKNQAEFTKIYEKYSHLFTREVIDDIRDQARMGYKGLVSRILSIA